MKDEFDVQVKSNIDLIHNLYNTTLITDFRDLFNIISNNAFFDFYLDNTPYIPKVGESRNTSTRRTIEYLIETEKYELKQERFNFRIFQEMGYIISDNIYAQLNITHNIDFDSALKSRGPIIGVDTQSHVMGVKGYKRFLKEEYTRRLDGEKCSFPAILEDVSFYVEFWDDNSKENYSVCFHAFKDKYFFSGSDSKNNDIVLSGLPEEIILPISNLRDYNNFKNVYHLGTEQSGLMNEYQFNQFIKDNPPMVVVKTIELNPIEIFQPKKKD